jgi:hypothetical protein
LNYDLSQLCRQYIPSIHFIAMNQFFSVVKGSLLTNLPVSYSGFSESKNSEVADQGTRPKAIAYPSQ